ncbi:MAG TPA: SPOR domain-containing protein [Firmicutes bacterium]|nr:SPOR domain-containing protein [Bacillota bacterium]
MATDKKKNDGSGKLGFAMLLIAVGACAIFIGFLIGQWLMDLLAPSTPTIAFDSQSIAGALDEASSESPPSGSLSASTSPAVTSTPSTTSTTTETTLYRVQVGSFRHRENAEQLANRLRASGYEVYVTPEPYRVQVGAFSQRDNAEKLLQELKAQGYNDAFIVQ